MVVALLMFRSLFVKGVLVLMIGSSSSLSSYDEAQLWGWTGNDISFAWSALLASNRSRMDRSLGLTPFLSLQRT